MNNLSDSPGKESTYNIQSIVKAFNVINAFLSSEGDLNISEISQMCGMNQSTAYRIVATLKSCGIIEEDARTSFYRLGMGLLPLANKVLNQDGLLRFARPELNALTEKTNFNSHMGVLHENMVLIVIRVDAPGSRYTHAMFGRLVPLHCTSLGKALLFDHSREELYKILSFKGMQRLTKSSMTNPKALYEDLQRSVTRGYTMDNQEYTDGACCIGAPVRAANGKIVAAISVSGLATEFLKRSEEEIAQAVTYHAKRISAAVGYQTDLV